MKRPIAILLVSLLLAPPVSARQNKPLEWPQVRKLRPGAEVMLTVSGGQPAKVQFLSADDAVLVTFKATALRLPQDFVVGLGHHWQAIVDDAATYRFDRLRVSQEGLFDHDRKLAALEDLVLQTPRGEVVEVVVQPSWWSRNWGWFVPAVVGVLLLGGFLGAASGT